jgi:septum formation protein
MPDSNKKWTLVLASSSPRRKELLSHLKVPFRIQVADIVEVSNKTCPQDFVLDIAQQKGAAILAQVSQENCVVISADTVVALDGKIYGKPKSSDEALATLKKLAGVEHQVYTAVCLAIRKGGSEWKHWQLVAETQVTFLSANERLMRDYVNSGDPMDKAGAYGIQGQALTMIAGIKGCYANVMGFPLSQFNLLMEEALKSELQGSKVWQDLF